MTEENNVENSVVVTPAAKPTMLADIDKMALELAKSRRQVALAQAEKAMAQQESAEIAYRYVVLQLYMKYSLSSDDAINEDGTIIINGAKKL